MYLAIKIDINDVSKVFDTVAELNHRLDYTRIEAERSILVTPEEKGILLQHLLQRPGRALIESPMKPAIAGIPLKTVRDLP